MKRIIFFAAIFALALQGCTYFQPKTNAATPEGFGKARSSDLIVTPAETTATVEWGTAYEIPLDVSWAAGQKYAVQLAIAEGTPDWLSVEILPAIIEPPGRATLRITPAASDAEIGETDLTIEASAYGLAHPLQKTITLDLQRESGEFEYVETAPASRECRNVCGKIKDGQLTFYDLLKEKDQFCDDKTKLPDSQKLGVLSYRLSSKGYGYGRTCRVAVIFEASGNLTFFNLGLTSKLPRGANLLTIRGATDCWLSPDNTLVLAKISGTLIPYDVASGRNLGSPCRISRDPQMIRLDGVNLTADDCSWKVK